MADEAGLASHDTSASNAPSRLRNDSSSGMARLKALTALTGFWSIPRELQQRILALACQTPLLPRRTSVGRSFDCPEAMLRFTNTSRFFYILVTPWLYRNIRITRPSTLVQLQRTLASRPALGQLVKTLHIGPDAALSREWFPVRSLGCSEESHVNFKLNVGERIDKWDGSFQELEIGHVDEEDDAALQALEAAFYAASHCLNVDLGRAGFDHSGAEIGSDVWHIRIFEVQAAVEIYCFEMRRCLAEAQKKAPARKKRKTKTPSIPLHPVSYPLLLVDGASQSSYQDHAAKEDVFRVPRWQILARMASPGAPTDAFNHPLLFARSGLSWHAVGPADEAHQGDQEYDDNSSGAEKIRDVFSADLPTITPADTASMQNERCDPLGLTTSSSTTVGGNLGLARSVLAFAPKLRSLALTGIFQQLLIGEQPASLPALRSISIGPAPPRWHTSLLLNHSGLQSLTELRIVGIPIIHTEISSLSGAEGSLLCLRTLRWTMAREYAPLDPNSILDFLFELLEIQSPQWANVALIDAASSSRKNEDTAALQGCAKARRKPRSLYLDFRLHPKDVDRILKAAPSDEVADAWRKGEAVDGVRHRLKLVANEVCGETGQLSGTDGGATQAIYDEGVRWWE